MRRTLFVIVALMPLLLAAAQPMFPKLHSALNVHLQAYQQQYDGAAPLKAMPPTDYRVALRDLNGDGFDDVVVSAPGMTGSPGRVYIQTSLLSADLGLAGARRILG